MRQHPVARFMSLSKMHASCGSKAIHGTCSAGYLLPKCMHGCSHCIGNAIDLLNKRKGVSLY